MSNVVPFGPKQADRPSAAEIRAKVSRQANRITAAMKDRPMADAPKDRLKLAENLHGVLEAATRGHPSVSKFDILHACGQAPHKEDSTKRLYRFAVDPSLPIEERDARAKKHLARHVKKYADIARKAAELSGMDGDDALVRLALGTSYERPANESESSPYDDVLDDVLADIQTAVELRLEKHISEWLQVGEYFTLLRRHKLTLDSAGPEPESSSGQLRFAAKYNAWTATYLQHRARHFVSDAVFQCIPKVMIGQGFLRTVLGKLVLKTGKGVQPYSREPFEVRQDRIDLPAHIDFYIDVALGICGFGDPPAAGPALLISLAIAIRLREGTSFSFFRGEGDDDDDHSYLELDDFDPVARSEVWTERLNYCDLVATDLEDAVGKKLVTAAYYTVDKADVPEELRELLQPGPHARWLVEPLTVAAQKKWLLREMRDEDGRPVDIAIPDWVSTAANVSHVTELTFALVGQENLRQKATPLVHHIRAKIDEWKQASSYEPVSCPEGTLAAALERGVFEGSARACGPAECIASEFFVLDFLLKRDLEAAATKRKSFLNEL